MECRLHCQSTELLFVLTHIWSHRGRAAPSPPFPMHSLFVDGILSCLCGFPWAALDSVALQLSLRTAGGRGFGLAACPALGLLVTSCKDSTLVLSSCRTASGRTRLLPAWPMRAPWVALTRLPPCTAMQFLFCDETRSCASPWPRRAKRLGSEWGAQTPVQPCSASACPPLCTCRRRMWGPRKLLHQRRPWTCLLWYMWSRSGLL